MAIGVVRVGGFGGDFQTPPDHGRAEDIQQTFHSVGDERITGAEHTGHDLQRCEGGIDEDAHQGEACAVFESPDGRCLFAHSRAA